MSTDQKTHSSADWCSGTQEPGLCCNESGRKAPPTVVGLFVVWRFNSTEVFADGGEDIEGAAVGQGAEGVGRTAGGEGAHAGRQDVRFATDGALGAAGEDVGEL